MKIKQLFYARSPRCAKTLIWRIRDAHVFTFRVDSIARAASLVACPGVTPQIIKLFTDPEAKLRGLAPLLISRILSQILARKGCSRAGLQAKLLTQAFDNLDFTHSDVDSTGIDVNDLRALNGSVWEGIKTKLFHLAKGETGRARYVISV